MAASVVYSTFGGRIVAEQRGGVVRQYVADNLGSTVALIDTNGAVTDTYDYWPYGEERVHTGSSTTPFTFCGVLGYFKDFLNTLYVRARHLRVDLSRWMSTDTLWPYQQPYGYVRQAPCSRTDRSGRLSGPILAPILLNPTPPLWWLPGPQGPPGPPKPPCNVWDYPGLGWTKPTGPWAPRPVTPPQPVEPEPEPEPEPPAPPPPPTPGGPLGCDDFSSCKWIRDPSHPKDPFWHQECAFCCGCIMDVTPIHIVGGAGLDPTISCIGAFCDAGLFPR